MARSLCSHARNVSFSFVLVSLRDAFCNDVLVANQLRWMSAKDELSIIVRATVIRDCLSFVMLIQREQDLLRNKRFPRKTPLTVEWSVIARRCC